MKTKNYILIIFEAKQIYFTTVFLFFLFTNVYSQRSEFDEIKLTPGGVLESVFDRYGTKYEISDLLIANSSSSLETCSSTSYFNLYFELGSGMEDTTNPVHNARRAVVCKVFEDLSHFINSPLTTTGYKVNIWVRNINSVMENPNGVLGLASSFYNVPYNSSSGGIADNEVWKTIHIGYDSYLNSTVPLTVFGGSSNQPDLFYHGMITFNFNSTNTPAINYNTDLTTTTIPINHFDLYTVVLHEATHTLGFISLINENGDSVFGSNNKYYSRYDRFLKTNDLSQFLLISAGCSTMYDYSFNPLLNSVILHPNPTNAPCNDNTICSDAIKFAGTTTVPVFTPNCFNPISSLIHFEDAHFPSCDTTNPIYGNDNYFLMCNAGNSGMIRRYLKPEERNTLCDIGYSVKTTFGSSNVRISPTAFGPFNYGSVVCNGITVAGINDGINLAGTFNFFGEIETDISISGNTILSNDINATGFECLEDLTATNANPTYLSATSGTSLTEITFNSDLPGVHLLRYVPINGTQKGNITYIYVNVFPIVDICTTAPSTCNLVRNGDFEANDVDVTQSSNFQFNNVCDWMGRGFITNYFLQNNNTLTHSVPCNFFGFQNDNVLGNNAYGGIRCHRYGNGAQTSGILATRLTSPLLPNTTYQIKFDVSEAEFNRFSNFNTQAFVSSIEPNLIANAGTSSGFITNDQLLEGLLLSNSVVNSNFNEWETLTFTFTTSSTQNNLQFLYLGVLSNPVVETDLSSEVVNGCFFDQHYYPQTGANYFIDNVSLITIGEAELNLPASICISQSLNNLSQYLIGTPPNGEFTGAGVTVMDGIYSFNASTAGIGNHTISYTFHNNLGCPITISDTIEVTIVSSITIPINAVNDDFTSMPIETTTGGITTSVYANDFYDGQPSSATSLPNVNFSLVEPILIQGATINSYGLISIPADTPVGAYLLTYKLQVIGDCNTFDTATVQIIVTSFDTTPTLVAGLRADNFVNNIELQSNNKSIISGAFRTYNNILAHKIARLNTNLTLDTSFYSTGPNPNTTIPYDLKIHSDDKIVLVGSFIGFSGGSNGNGIARLLSNGAIDLDFNSGGPGFSSLPGRTSRVPKSCAIQSDGKIVVGGDFGRYNGADRLGIARLQNNGQIDNSFDPSEINTFYRCIVNKITLQPDGKMILIGLFQPSTEGALTQSIIRLDPNGSIDYSFHMGNTIGSVVHSDISTTLTHHLSNAILQPDGKIIVVGAFSKFNGENVYNIVRLEPDGSIDPSFQVSAVLIEQLSMLC